MSARTGLPGSGPAAALLAPALLVPALLLAGCSGTSPPTRAGAVAAVPRAPAEPPAADGPRATLGGVELGVTVAHLLPGTAGDPGARSAADQLGVPVSRVVQMHLVLSLRRTGAGGADVSGDALQLGLGTRWVAPVPGQVFPQEPLAQGEERETAVGFWVAPRAGTGPVTLRWTSGGRTAVLPLDQVPTGA